MAKLNQIIAVEKGVKSTSTAAISDLYKKAQKPDLFGGLTKVYAPLNEEDTEKLPGESKRVQLKVPGVVDAVANAMSELLNITARKDWTNCDASAPIVVDGKTLIDAVPVTYLLFLEKQVTDIRTFVANLPILDEGEIWSFDPNAGLWKTALTATHRTKKVPRPITLAAATEHHPAQVQLLQEDIYVGNWNLTKMSGAIPLTVRIRLLESVEKLLIAVKEAREAANMAEVVSPPDVAGAIFGYLFPSDAFAGGTIAAAPVTEGQ